MTEQGPVFNIDVHSFAQPQVAVVTHLDLKLEVDFKAKILNGVATYTIKTSSEAAEIIFDTQGLEIQEIKLNAEAAADFKLGPEKLILGQPLIVPITPATQKVAIWYRTTPAAAALQWLNPEQTSGKKYPFLFTQSQAILARTWLPCQDSPGIRFTYQAQVQVPTYFLALMSADNPQVKNRTGIYTFTQSRPIPSYLMALAVGEIEFRALDDRTGIYAEPDQLEAAAYEFAELPAMLSAAEAIYGNYLWGRYDLLLLPPSFPFGGMENPQLTFVTPTIIAGDRSLTSLVAHELAHSWSGNLVTNATWNDFWLNEGFTVYFERRIMEVLYGKDYADMLKVLGFRDLKQTLEELGFNSPDTPLKLNLLNRDPDEGLTEIAYEKGNYFLLTLEATYGRTTFDAFVRRYFRDYAFKAMDTERFTGYLNEQLLQQDPLENNKPINPAEWIYEPGLPDNGPVLTSRLFNQVEEAAKNWCNHPATAKIPGENWSTHEWLYFLHQVEPQLTQTNMAALDQQYRFTQSGNTEILAVWFRQAIELAYEPAYPALEDFLFRVGRRKFLVPLYKAILQKDKAWASRIYEKARPNYHAIATGTLDNLLL